jgi:hypothetical protein
MSGNIKDTDVLKLRELVNEFIQDMDIVIKNGESVSDYKEIYKIKYKYIFDTSTTLYKLIYDQYNSLKVDKTHMLNNLNMMLVAIENIQKSQITQYDASESIGEVLASQYIPQLKKQQPQEVGFDVQEESNLDGGPGTYPEYDNF